MIVKKRAAFPINAAADLPERFGISDGRNSRSARDEVKVLDLTCFLLYNYYVRIAVEIYISVPGFSRSQFKSERGGNTFRSRKPLIGLQQFNRSHNDVCKTIRFCRSNG